MKVQYIPMDSKEIAYTDCYSKICIRYGLPTREHDIVMRHERFHCAAQHGARCKAFRRMIEDFSHDKWNIACDLEIARAIYTDGDEAVMRAPRSCLAKGVFRDSFGVDPALILAEEIYHAIPDGAVAGFDGHEETDGEETDGEETDGEETDGEETDESASALRDAAVREDEECQRQQQLKQATENTAKQCEVLLRRRTIASEIDAIAQAATSRSREFKRPSRRPIDGILTRADIFVDKRPKVLVYIDRSGSFCADKTAKAEEKIKALVRRHGDRIEASFFFFGDNSLRAEDSIRGGNTPYKLVANHIEEHLPKAAIIITDDDGHEPWTAPKETSVSVIAIGCDKSAALRAWSGIKARE